MFLVFGYCFLKFLAKPTYVSILPELRNSRSRQEIFAHCMHLLLELINGAPNLAEMYFKDNWCKNNYGQLLLCAF